MGKFGYLLGLYDKEKHLLFVPFLRHFFGKELIQFPFFIFCCFMENKCIETNLTKHITYVIIESLILTLTQIAN